MVFHNSNRVIYVAKNPPSTGKVTPFIIELRSLNKYTTASTTSSISEKRKRKKNKKIIVHTSMMVGGKEKFIIQRNRIEKRTCESSQWNFADHT